MLPTTEYFMSAGKTFQAELFNPSSKPKPNGGVIIIVHGSDGLVDNEWPLANDDDGLRHLSCQ